MAKVDNPNERVLGNNNLIVTSSIKEPTTNTFTLKFIEMLSAVARTQTSIFDITEDPSKSNALAVIDDGASIPIEVTIQVPIGHQLLISGLRVGQPLTSGWGVANPALINCNYEEESVSGYLPNEITVSIQDSPASIEMGWQYGIAN